MCLPKARDGHHMCGSTSSWGTWDSRARLNLTQPIPAYECSVHPFGSEMTFGLKCPTPMLQSPVWVGCRNCYLGVSCKVGCWLLVKENQWFNLVAPRSAVSHSPFKIHVQKKYSDQHWYEMHYHLLILHTNFIWWLVNGLKISDCHKCLKIMFRKNIQISIGMKFMIICQLYPKISYGDW